MSDHQVIPAVTEPNAFMLLDELTLCAKASGLALERVRELAAFAREREQPIVEVLVERGGVEEAKLLSGLARQLDMGFADDDTSPIPAEVLRQISAALAIRHQVIPLREERGRLYLASADPFEYHQWDELAQVLGRPVERVLCPRSVIRRLLKSSYGLGADTVERLVADKVNAAGSTGLEVRGGSTNLSEEEAANEPTVVNLVNKIIAEAIQALATDIHFEPYDSKYRVRYRIDGMLEDVSIPVSVKLLKLALVSRIKIMSNLDITEKRLPQDGRCQVTLNGREYDLRVSILPGVYGEAVVIRIQSRGMVRLELEALGYEADEQDKISDLIHRPNGLVLVTGPTGSGKTTTLYTCLTKINKPDVKIITIEDPVEYWMEDLLQMQVHEDIDFTFASALRGILRHDPDIILVGEIRDRETTDIAIRSSLTGHLVFATLHTNDASSAISRLLDLGVEPFLLASSLRGILAQRLVRRICDRCKQPVPREQLAPAELELVESQPGWQDVIFWKGRGCEHCRFTGFRSRLAIAEILRVNTALRKLIQQRAPAEEVKIAAVQAGMRTLLQSGLLSVKAGKTAVSEVYRVTQEDL